MNARHTAEILIIEDEILYLDILVSVLQPHFRVLVAKSGEQGLQRLRSGQQPDLILLDVVMPGIDGYETCRRIKADPKTQEIPVIFLTARNDVDGETFGLDIGAVDYIAKPISPPTMLARIRTHLSLRQAQQALKDHNLYLEDRVKERTESLRRVGAELVLAEERERRRIAQELHDGPTQRLVLSKLNLGRLRSAVDPAQQQAMEDVTADIDTTLKELRTLMVELSPPALYELGLGPAVEWLAETILGKHNIVWRVDSAESYADLTEAMQVFLFQSTRELLINIVKHANAKRASVAINTHEGDILIEVRDDGIGIEADSRPGECPDSFEQGGFGLFTLKDRIDMLGGEFECAANDGTRITMRVPMSTVAEST